MLTAALCAVLAPPALAQISAFTWTLAGNPDGSGTQTPTSLHVVGPDNFSCNLGHTTQFETTIPATGMISVDLDFTNLDSGVVQGHALFDSPAVLVDGELTQPPSAPCCPNGWPSGRYHFDVPVIAGQVLGLGVWSADCSEGPGVADYTSLEYVPDEQAVSPVAIDVRLRCAIDGADGDKLGVDVAGLDDINGDGRGDIAVIRGKPVDPRIELRSGDDGAVLQSVAGLNMNAAAVLAAAGDFNGDGMRDLVVGMPGLEDMGNSDTGACEVRSGVDGSVLGTIMGSAPFCKLGFAVAGVGDVDGNGKDDVLVSAPGTFLAAGVVRLLGGASGQLITSFAGAPSTRFGYAVAGGGDADDDGVPDIVVGEPGWTSGAVGTVHVYSGATFLQLIGPTGTGGFGKAVAWAGDVDGDDHDDVLVAAPDFSGAGSSQGRVTLWSGASGALLLTLTGEASGVQLGLSLAGGSDLTGDGHPDVVALARAVAGAWEVRVYDAVTGVLEHVLRPGVPSFELARGLDILPDVNGDGLDDLVASSSTDGSADQGRLAVFHNLDRGPPPVLAVAGTIAPSAPITITIEGLLPSASVWLVAGLAELSLPFKGGVLVPSPDLILALAADAAGHVGLPATWPAGLPQWTTVYLQAWTQDGEASQGWVGTDGLALTQLVP